MKKETIEGLREAVKNGFTPHPTTIIALLDIAERTTSPVSQMTDATIREIFMAHGFTIKEGQTDLKPYVYAAARALLAAAAPHAQAPAVQQESIDSSQYFGKLLSRVAEFGFNGGHERALVAYIDAKLAQVAQDKTDYANQLIEDCRKLRDRATAAEAKLEAIRQSVDDLEHFWVSVDGQEPCIVIRDRDVLDLFTTPPKADESGLPG